MECINYKKELEVQLENLLSIAKSHFKSHGYKMDRSKTSELNEIIFSKNDYEYTISFWKNTKHAYASLISVIEGLGFNTEETFRANLDNVEEHYNSVKSNIDRIINDIKKLK